MLVPEHFRTGPDNAMLVRLDEFAEGVHIAFFDPRHQGNIARIVRLGGVRGGSSDGIVTHIGGIEFKRRRDAGGHSAE